MVRWLRRKPGSILLGGCCLVVSCLAVIGSWVGWSKLNLPRFRSNPNLMRNLQQAPLLRIGSPPATAVDWPQWRGPNRDGLSLESGLLTDWPTTGPPLLWEKMLGRGFSAPIVAGGRIYTMAQENAQEDIDGSARETSYEAVICWDAATGQELWKFRYISRYEERMGSGPRSTPCVDGDYVYAVGPTGIFHCLRADTGEKVWRHDLLEEFHAKAPQYGVSFSPLVEGDLVYVAPGGPNGGSVAAFHKRSGVLAWHALDDPMGYSSPLMTTAAGVRQLLVFTNNALVSLSPSDGTTNWRFDWETTGGFNIATPIAFDNYVFLSSAYGKGCALLEISGNADGSLGAKSVYEHNRMRNYFASSVRYREHIYGFDNNDLTCMDIRTGNILWRVRADRGFKKGSLLSADGYLIVLDESGKLALAEAAPDGYIERASFQVSENKCWTVPVLAGGRLYIRDESRLRCLDLRR
jgi:outer membrane protein assembly factor BamB